MDDGEFEALRVSAEEILKTLYIVDLGSLTADQRKAHQEALSAAYLAVVRIENSALDGLSALARKRLEPLAKSARDLRDQLAGLKKAKEVIAIVAGGINVLASIAKLLK